MAVYLLHFESKFHHAQHYIGYTNNLPQRIAEHKKGQGARLLEVIQEVGIDWRPSRVWWFGDRSLERKLKRQHHSARLCPICNPSGWTKHAYREFETSAW